MVIKKNSNDDSVIKMYDRNKMVGLQFRYTEDDRDAHPKIFYHQNPRNKLWKTKLAFWMVDENGLREDGTFIDFQLEDSLYDQIHLSYSSEVFYPRKADMQGQDYVS